jgi:peroxiredoxin
MNTLSIGQIAPTFTLKDLERQSYTLNKSNARLTLTVFFKTTCPTCMIAFPYIEKIHRAYHDTGLAVWGISQHDRDRSADFAIKYGSTFPILIDSDWQVSRAYDPAFVPTLWLIDPAGNIIDCVVAFDKAGLNRLSQTIAARLDVPAVLVAPDNDGNPAFKPG